MTAAMSNACRPSAWILTDGKIGDAVPCQGLAGAMGLSPEHRVVHPRKAFAATAPWGHADPRDARTVLHPPFPSVAFAAGRRTVPYLRWLKRMSPGTFTVFLGNPRVLRHGADAVWAPAHDRLVGPRVISTATTPHVYSPQALAHAAESPDPRVAALPVPRAGLLIGGPSRHHPFGGADAAAVVRAAITIRAQGFSLAATASRRTPASLVVALRTAFASDRGAFFWSGEGENPYGSILALSQAIVVTADSTNMISEALAAGVPVHILPLTGGHPRLDAFVAGLVSQGTARPWVGVLAGERCQPVDATPAVAAEIARRFADFRQAPRARFARAASGD